MTATALLRKQQGFAPPQPRDRPFGSHKDGLYDDCNGNIVNHCIVARTETQKVLRVDGFTQKAAVPDTSGDMVTERFGPDNRIIDFDGSSRATHHEAQRFCSHCSRVTSVTISFFCSLIFLFSDGRFIITYDRQTYPHTTNHRTLYGTPTDILGQVRASIQETPPDKRERCNPINILEMMLMMTFSCPVQDKKRDFLRDGVNNGATVHCNSA